MDADLPVAFVWRVSAAMVMHFRREGLKPSWAPADRFTTMFRTYFHGGFWRASIGGKNAEGNRRLYALSPCFSGPQEALDWCAEWHQTRAAVLAKVGT